MSLHIQSNEEKFDPRIIAVSTQINHLRPDLPGLVPEGWRADSSSSIVTTARQLVFVISEVYRQEFPECKGVEFLTAPKQRAALGTRQFTWHEMEIRGSAVVNVELEKDSPPVDVGIEEQPFQKFAWIQQKYGWSITDTWTSDLTGINVQAERAKATKQTIAHKHDDLLLIADGSPLWGGLRGMYNLTGTLTYAIDVGATSGATLWVNKTGEEIFTDLMRWFWKGRNDTNTIETANTTLLPETSFQIALEKRMGDANQKNPIQHFLDTLKETKMAADYQVLPSLKLNGLGAGGTGRAITYHAGDATKVMRNDVVEFYQLTPVIVGTGIEVHCFGKSGGAVPVRKKSMVYTDGL